jgi:hypothetical protein
MLQLDYSLATLRLHLDNRNENNRLVDKTKNPGQILTRVAISYYSSIKKSVLRQ